MTYARVATGAFVRGYNTTITPALTGYAIGNLLLAATGVTMNAGAIPAATIGNWTRVSPITNATHTLLYASIALTTADAMPGFLWSDSCWAKAWAVSGNPGTLTGIVDNSKDGAANNTRDAGFTTTAGSFTPGGSNRYVVHVANKNKTSASNATVFSPASGFTLIDQSVPTSGPAAIIGEWFQSTAALVGTTACVGTVADASVQATQGFKIAFVPGVASFAPYPSLRRQVIQHTESIFD